MRTVTLPLAAALAATAYSADAAAAPPWVERHLTLPSGNFAFDVGLGVTNHSVDPVAAGMNLEMGVGLTSHIELGVRTGLRFGNGVERNAQADFYGRLYDLQTIDEGNGVLANPEVRLRGAVVRGEVGEVALEGRAILPFDPGTPVGLQFGVPIALHLGDRVRFDTGVYVDLEVGLHGGTDTAVSLPFDLWIQATPRFWIGPVTDVAFDHGDATGLIGMGLGYEITHAVDFKAMALFPVPEHDVIFFGAGAGVQIRIE